MKRYIANFKTANSIGCLGISVKLRHSPNLFSQDNYKVYEIMVGVGLPIKVMLEAFMVRVYDNRLWFEGGSITIGSELEVIDGKVRIGDREIMVRKLPDNIR